MSAAVVASAVVGAVVAGATSAPAFAGSIQSDQAQASQLTAEIAAKMAQIDRLSQQYDEAQTQYQTTAAALSQVKTELASAVADAASTKRQLRQAALAAYMGDESSSAVAALFETDTNTVAARGEYQRLSDGQLTGAIDRYESAEHTVSTEEAQLSSERASEQATLTSLTQTQQQAQAAVAQENSQLASVNSDLQQQLLAAAHALEVQKAEQEEQAAAAAAAQQQAAQQSAANPGSGTSLQVPPAPTQPVPPPSASWQQQAAVAVQTALNQVGTPYVWGGDSPGGFDCSGLVMYAWETAGVDLPHYSVSQYEDTTHITESELQPGDIVFYNSPDDGYLGHEAMYIGNGQVVQAPTTGMDVMVTSITWAGPPVAFGQPN